MSFEAVAHYLISPLTIALLLGVVSLAFASIRWRRTAATVAFCGFAFLWICSTPWVADALLMRLENQYPPFAAADAPRADAILLLGGIAAGAKPPERPTMLLGQSASRVWHAAALYRAGKAPCVVIAAGNRADRARDQVEADALAEVLIQLGVPDRAIFRERRSRTTRENARNVLAILEERRVRRVLLVTSGQHMPRALRTFEAVWPKGAPQLIPATTDMRGEPPSLTDVGVWLPSLSALLSVSTSTKEFAGMAALSIIR